MRAFVGIMIIFWTLSALIILTALNVENYRRSLNQEYVDNLMIRAVKICGTPVEYFAIEKGDLRVGCRGEL
jgi:hypothetical protein